MSNIYAELVRAARNSELEEEIERQHNEITELNSRLSNALEERDELGKVVDAQGLDLKEVAQQLEQLSEVVSSVISDLRVLSEVPLSDLEEAISSITCQLVEQNGEIG